jgi:hypothetical protein
MRKKKVKDSGGDITSRCPAAARHLTLCEV